MYRSVMTAAEVARSMDCSESAAYKIIAQLNAELKSKGYIIRRGRISRKYFQERTGLEPLDKPAGLAKEGGQTQ